MLFAVFSVKWRSDKVSPDVIAIILTILSGKSIAICTFVPLKNKLNKQ